MRTNLLAAAIFSSLAFSGCASLGDKFTEVKEVPRDKSVVMLNNLTQNIGSIGMRCRS